jgi:hypothetical protein
MIASLAGAQTISAAPSTPKHPVTDEYQGVKDADDYRWLERCSVSWGSLERAVRAAPECKKVPFCNMSAPSRQQRR